MSVNWENPYELDLTRWHKGNLHTHCTPNSPCASINLDDLFSAYADLGYSFIAISDHLSVTTATYPELRLLPGMEWNSLYGVAPNKAIIPQRANCGENILLKVLTSFPLM